MKMPKAHPISWILLLVTTLAILATSVSRIILPTVLPAIMEEFHWSRHRSWFPEFGYVHRCLYRCYILWHPFRLRRFRL